MIKEIYRTTFNRVVSVPCWITSQDYSGEPVSGGALVDTGCASMSAIDRSVAETLRLQPFSRVPAWQAHTGKEFASVYVVRLRAGSSTSEPLNIHVTVCDDLRRTLNLIAILGMDCISGLKITGGKLERLELFQPNYINITQTPTKELTPC